MTFTLDDKKYTYTPNTKFIIELGKDKGAYRQKHTMSNIDQAFLYYKGYNIAFGFKKRLVMKNGNVRTVLAKYLS